MRIRLAALFAFLFAPVVVAQGVPTTIPYQGRLADGGTPVTAATSLTFSLHDAATAGTQVWTESHTLTPSAEGDVSVLLGSATSLASLDFDRPLWLEVEAGGTTLGPRTPLGSAPYALGLALPFVAQDSDASPLIDIENTTGSAIRGVAGPSIRGLVTTGGSFENSATTGRGVVGHASSTTGTTYGVRGEVDSPNGYAGYFIGGRGVYAAGAADRRAGEFLNAGGSGFSTATLFAQNTSTGAGIAAWLESTGSDATLVVDQDGTGDILRGFNQGTLRFSIAASGDVTADGQIYGESGIRGDATDSTPLPWAGYFQSTSTVSGGVVGLATATTGFTAGGRFETFSVNGYGVIGEAKATSGTTYGVYGVSEATAGTGVYGWARSTTGATHGGYFRNASTGGVGAFGWAQAATGPTMGLYGLTNSTSGRGVYGLATQTSGTTYGVRGENRSPDGAAIYGDGSHLGVLGEASASTGQTFGGRFISASADGEGLYAEGGQRGVTGIATSTSLGITYGGYFESASGSGQGVYGLASNQTQNNGWGVYGRSLSPRGHGVVGVSTFGSTQTFGGRFESQSTAGTGVYGLATRTTGTTYGVYGQVQSPDGYAGYFVGGQGVYTDGAYLGGGADFAEWLPLASSSATPRAGDVVGVTAGRVGLATEGAEQVMIVSSNPAFVGNPDAAEGGALVALVGQAKVRLVSSNAQVGDLLVASGASDGTARAVSPARYNPATDGVVIGRVLALAEDGMAVALVGVDEAAALREVVISQQNELADQRRQIESLAADRDRQRERLDAQQARMDALVRRLDAMDLHDEKPAAAAPLSSPPRR